MKLVVDDIAENRDILRNLLADLGAEVETAGSGQQALDLLAPFQPNIVFLDIRMPEMDGRQVLQYIKQDPQWQDLKVVAVSASVLQHERREFLNAGFVDFIPKPFRFEQICACLNKHLAVEFTATEASVEPPKDEPSDWNQVVLPVDLSARLRRAAELYSVTEVENYLREMEELGNEEQQLAAHLRTLRQRHDMEALLKVVAKIRHA